MIKIVVTLYLIKYFFSVPLLVILLFKTLSSSLIVAETHSKLCHQLPKIHIRHFALPHVKHQLRGTYFESPEAYIHAFIEKIAEVSALEWSYYF